MAQINPIPICSYADDGIGARFGIRSERMAAGNRLPHRHDYFEVLFFVSGASTQSISIREHLTRRGSVFFISPMTAHQVRFDPTDSCFVLYFDLAFLRPDLAATPSDIDIELLARVPELAPFVYQKDVDFILSDGDIDVLKALCDRMLAERLSPRLCSAEIIRSHLVILLAEVTQRYEHQVRALMHNRPPSGGRERHVRGVMKFIATNLAERFSLTDAARKVSVSPNYLAGLLKRETGKTFVELVTEQRMDRACELLTFTSMRVSQIADAAGFVDFDYFCRRFKQVTRYTPLQFRACHAIGTVNRPSAAAKAGLAQPHA
jgi:AraC family transcriptional regulator, transcriptional activator of pobA